MSSAARPGGETSRRSPISVESVTAGALLVVGVAYGVGALNEGFGSVHDTGAGFFPFLVAVILVPAAAFVLVQELRGTATSAPADEDEEDFQGEVHWPRIGGVLVASAVVPAVGDDVGLVTTLSVAMIVIAKIMGLKGWWAPVALGVAFGVATWLIFVQWLYVPLPAGRLGLA
ncbi:tripartite tricarboxylate transporter TctB family protein [Aeromicrobium terrae]|uniref:Tripartite tricarboxylate transporter TctB family protein n=1 Tax=Aeromicrobium terrae TaxID=2498846 RepID=A0A5C8NHT4_9ACTN|nr:tripartite tricarboxylate transporter TctB family protein [Aeromicrobium terrae]TXL60722.1 tripartite tricarboxylate transporter TctB family protein [Aeromicrobium terrae]